MRRLWPKSVSSTWSKPKYGPCQSSVDARRALDRLDLAGREERERRREVRLAEHRGARSPARPSSVATDRSRRVGGQVDAVARDAVRRRIRAGEDRGPRGLAQRVLRARGREPGALRGERVEARRRAERRSLDAERVGALLVGRDQETFDRPSRCHVCSASSTPRRRPMEALRTPDERFDALPDFPFAPHYVEVSERRRRRRCGSTTSTRARRRRRRAAHARRAVVVLPVPQDDPGAHGRRACAASRPTSSGFGRSDKPTERADYTYAAPRRVDARRALRRARPARRHARLPGLGRADRAAPRRRAPRPLRARRRRQHVPADRRDSPPGEAFLNWQHFSQTVEDFDVGFIVGHAAARPSSPTT